MKRPSFQFYPADWLSNKNLRRCSFHHRGIWADLMCLFHDSDEYGILRWTLQEISNAVGCNITDLQDLIRYGILKGIEKDIEKVSFSTTISKKNSSPEKVTLIDDYGPLYFSSRMVRDEYIRKQRAQHGIKSLDNSNVPRKKNNNIETEKDIDKDTFSNTEKDTFSPSPSSSSSSSSSNINTNTIPYKEIINRLNEKSGKNYKANSKATKTHIHARWEEGYRLNDFFYVIDVKCAQWKGTDQEEFLRPETLFGTKFEGYRNQKPKSIKPSLPDPHSNNGLYQAYLIARQADYDKFKSTLNLDELRSKFRDEWLAKDPEYTTLYPNWEERLEPHFQHKLANYIQGEVDFPSFDQWKGARS